MGFWRNVLQPGVLVEGFRQWGFGGGVSQITLMLFQSYSSRQWNFHESSFAQSSSYKTFTCLQCYSYFKRVGLRPGTFYRRGFINPL